MTTIIDATVGKVINDLSAFLQEHPEMERKLHERDDDEGFFEVMTAFHEWAEHKLQQN